VMTFRHGTMKTGCVIPSLIPTRKHWASGMLTSNRRRFPPLNQWKEPT